MGTLDNPDFILNTSSRSARFFVPQLSINQVCIVPRYVSKQSCKAICCTFSRNSCLFSSSETRLKSTGLLVYYVPPCIQTPWGLDARTFALRISDSSTSHALHCRRAVFEPSRMLVHLCKGVKSCLYTFE